jgi:hypothetical protein
MQNFDRVAVTMFEGEEKPRRGETRFWSVIFLLAGMALLAVMNAFLR